MEWWAGNLSNAFPEWLAEVDSPLLADFCRSPPAASGHIHPEEGMVYDQLEADRSSDQAAGPPQQAPSAIPRFTTATPATPRSLRPCRGAEPAAPGASDLGSESWVRR